MKPFFFFTYFDNLFNFLNSSLIVFFFNYIVLFMLLISDAFSPEFPFSDTMLAVLALPKNLLIINGSPA